MTPISTTAVCDGRHEHEARVITDGHRSYGYVLEPAAYELGVGTLIEGDPLELEWACPGSTASDEGCTGYFRIELTPDQPWASTEARGVLDSYGVEVGS